MITYPTISVLTITYGQEQYIKQTLDGVLEQNYPGEIEFLIVNDNSPDSTNDIIENYLSNKVIPENFNVKYTNHKINKGMMPNFIWALRQATGSYIAICEGDDYWIDKSKLSKQIDFFKKNPNCVFHFTAAKTLTNDGALGHYYKHADFKNGIINKRNFLQNMGGDYCTATAIFDKKVVDPLPPYILNCIVGDFPLGLSALSQGEIGYSEDVTTVYRLNSVGSWSSKQKQDQLLKKIDNLLATMSDFDDFTNHKFSNLVRFYNKEYKYRLIYRRILQSSTSDAIKLTLENLSFDFKKTYQMFKTLMWKFLKTK